MFLLAFFVAIPAAWWAFVIAGWVGATELRQAVRALQAIETEALRA